MAVKITQKYELFKDVDGDPLENGYIYIGTTGLNPETSPITVYFDEALTLPAPQPLRTSGGYIQNAGTPANIYVDTDYSIIVRNKNLTLIYTSLSNNAEAGLASSVDTIGDLIGLDEATTIEELEVYGYYAKGDGAGGLFIWDSTTIKANANAGTIIDPSVSLANQGTGVGTGCWIKQYSGIVNIKWFGAVGDGTTNDTDSFVKAVNEGSIFIPKGDYVIGEVVVPEDCSIIGENQNLVRILPLLTTGYIFKLSNRSSLAKITFYDPSQTYELTSDYLNESFVDNPVCISNNGSSMSVTVKEISIVGFNVFLSQSDEDTTDLSIWSFDNIRGFPLLTGFDVKRSFDILKFNNVHFNLNYYIKFGKTSINVNYYSKAMLQTKIFYFGRVDDAQISNCFIFGANTFLKTRLNAFTGDDGTGGGASITNSSADIVSNFLNIQRTDSSFGYSVVNGWCAPVVTPLSGDKQASFIIGGEANEIRVVNFHQFGTGHGVEDPAITKLADHFSYFELGSLYNRFLINNAQCIQLDSGGTIFKDYATNTPSLQNTFLGVVLDAAANFSGLFDVDGDKAIEVTDKKIKTYGIHNTDTSTDEGILSGSYTPSQGDSPNQNVASITHVLAIYTKVGKIVTVSGQFTFTPTATGVITEIYITRPILTTGGQAKGAGACFPLNEAIFVEPSGNDIKFVLNNPPTIDTRICSFTLQYNIV